MIKKKNVLHLGEIHDPEGVKIQQDLQAVGSLRHPCDVGLAEPAFYWGLPVVTEAGCSHPRSTIWPREETVSSCSENDVARSRRNLLAARRRPARPFSAAAREDIMRDASIERMFSASAIVSPPHRPEVGIVRATVSGES